MTCPKLDRARVKMKPLSERQNKVHLERDFVCPQDEPENLSETALRTIDEAAGRILEARRRGKPVILAFGAHTIKNGLAPVLVGLLEHGWVTHLATNGAGIIHDWEFAFQGASSEDVRAGIQRGEFGLWQETGFFINLGLNVGAYEGKGYGEAVGSMIENESLDLPAPETLEREIEKKFREHPEICAAACDLLSVIRRFGLKRGRLEIPHPYKKYSVQAAAYRLNVPFTGHPMFGHDIIYNHPMNQGASIGRAAERDFLAFAEAVSKIDGGVYLSVGSAVMSPMIFEKSMSMAQNLALARGGRIEGHYMLIVDLAESRWDWTAGEPPADNPAYYLRFNKTFSRMGGTMRYLSADNRDFLLELYRKLKA
ncbi:MAG TPA: hypothetical protein VM123_04630 [archaeon]|nr:hypothetical protein [archaeon]